MTTGHFTENTLPAPASARANTPYFWQRRAALALMIAATAAVALGAAEASAATNAVATANVNLRAGPGTQYPAVVALPQNAPVAIHGCLADRTWCDIGYAGNRGWVAANYIRVTSNGQQTVLTPALASAVGVGTVAFGAAYWDAYYRARPWYGQWNHYYGGVSRSATATCGPNGCGAAAVTRGPYGGGRAVIGGCGPEQCRGAAVTRGPRGNTVVRHGSFNRR